MQKLTRLVLMLVMYFSLSSVVLAGDTLQGESTVTVTIIEGENSPQGSSSEWQASEDKQKELPPLPSTAGTETRLPLPKTKESDSGKVLQLMGIYLLILLAVYKINRHKKENKHETI